MSFLIDSQSYVRGHLITAAELRAANRDLYLNTSSIVQSMAESLVRVAALAEFVLDETPKAVE